VSKKEDAGGGQRRTGSFAVAVRGVMQRWQERQQRQVGGLKYHMRLMMWYFHVLYHGSKWKLMY